MAETKITIVRCVKEKSRDVNSDFWKKKKSELQDINSELRDVNSEFWEKVRILRYKLRI